MSHASIPDTITVTEQHFEEIRSTGADVRLTASESGLGKGSSGRIAALRKMLGEKGFAEDDIMLHGVDRTPWGWIAIPLGIAVSFGVLFALGLNAALLSAGIFVLVYMLLAALELGTVTATYQVRCADAERVSRLLEALFDFGADVQSITWRYDIVPAVRSEWTARAIERAKGRADRIAAALGVRILGVHAFDEEHRAPQVTAPPPVVMAVKSERARAGKAMSVGESLGAAPSNAERAGVVVNVRYRVGPIEAAAS
ncbi:MAG: SIMPL domain-containing protein [Minicystis sp.]